MMAPLVTPAPTCLATPSMPLEVPGPPTESGDKQGQGSARPALGTGRVAWGRGGMSPGVSQCPPLRRCPVLGEEWTSSKAGSCESFLIPRRGVTKLSAMPTNRGRAGGI